MTGASLSPRHPKIQERGGIEMSNGESARRRPRLAGCVKIIAALMLALAVSLVFSVSAQAAFGIKAFDGAVSVNEAGDPFTQAGGHPNDAAVTIEFNSSPDPLFGFPTPEANVKDVYAELPPGLLGNPTAVPHCSLDLLFMGAVKVNGERDPGVTGCRPESQVGQALVNIGLNSTYAPVHILEPPSGSPAAFGFVVTGVRVIMRAELRSGGDYGITMETEGISQGLPIVSTAVELWGVPADSKHDQYRCASPGGSEGQCIGDPENPLISPNASSGEKLAFLSNPTACTPAGVGLQTRLRATAWQVPDVVGSSFESHLPPGYPLDPSEWGAPQGPTGCDKVPFDVEATVTPTDHRADTPTGLEVDLHMPQSGLTDPGGLATAHLRRAVVSLPAGMAVNPSVAGELEGCSSAQIALDSSEPPSCPDGSRIGEVEIETPLLERPINGSVYLAAQRENRFGALLATYIVAVDTETGVVVKLPGRIDTDPHSGQIRASFDEQPQLPFEDLHVEFFGGEKAPLVNPPTCGTYESTGEFTPWSGTPPVIESSSFEITAGPNGGPCPGAVFDPKLNAGTTNPVAGAYSPFVLRLSRDDGTQRLAGLSATMPEGLTGKLAGIPYCPDAALSAVSGADGTGAAEIGAPSCPAASQVGTVTVGAGAGPNPFYVNTGKAYLAGPYKGAPLSLAFVTPAVAGPFDLGSVLVRTALQVNPVTAQISAYSDPLPSILHGIPLNLRDVRIAMDRLGFMVNPTSCAPMAITGTANSTQGARAALSERFQVADCAALAFKPKLAMRLYGAPPRRGGYPKLKATLTMPEGGANIGKAVVTMPKTQLLENAHIRTICTRDQWAADSCPKGAIYGRARAFTPLLDQPLEGPVYLRANGGARELPDLVADLKGQIDIELVGYIDAVNARLRTRFVNVPDAPVSKFVLNMEGGRKGLLVNNTNICKKKPIASLKFDGQNGKTADSKKRVKVGGCGKSKRGGAKKR
jgi:hypothetical protein